MFGFAAPPPPPSLLGSDCFLLLLIFFCFSFLLFFGGFEFGGREGELPTHRRHPLACAVHTLKNNVKNDRDVKSRRRGIRTPVRLGSKLSGRQIGRRQLPSTSCENSPSSYTELIELEQQAQQETGLMVQAEQKLLRRAVVLF